ncbi:hypothetical protein [Janibacter sp. GS2]|uniref:hypothetical protein n=1 Tax=Janibacter sp. GS2 TaxID=3442646 RepID=UPI003EBC61AE
MSQDPYPNGRPSPDDGQPYSDDPYVPVNRPQQQPAYGGPPTPPPGGQLGPGAPAAPPFPYPTAKQPANVSAIVLTVVSGLATVTGVCCFVSIIPLVFGILGIVKQDNDPEGAAQMTKYGWISFAVIAALTIIGVLAFIAILVAAGA